MPIMRDFICLNCGKAFQRATRKTRPATFCCPGCSSSFHNKQRAEKNKRHEIKCEACGALFFPKNPNAKFCSVKCRGESMKKSKQRECQFCGKLFSSEARSHVCGEACWKKLRAWVALAMKMPHKRDQQTCEYCGGKFGASHIKKFCSKGCQLRARRTAVKRRVNTQSAWYTPHPGAMYEGWAQLNFGYEVNPLDPLVHPFNNMEIPYAHRSPFARLSDADLDVAV